MVKRHDEFFVHINLYAEQKETYKLRNPLFFSLHHIEFSLDKQLQLLIHNVLIHNGGNQMKKSIFYVRVILAAVK